MNILTKALENKAEQKHAEPFIVAPALSFNTNYSVTPSSFSDPVGQLWC